MPKYSKEKINFLTLGKMLTGLTPSSTVQAQFTLTTKRREGWTGLQSGHRWRVVVPDDDDCRVDGCQPVHTLEMRVQYGTPPPSPPPPSPPRPTFPVFKYDNEEMSLRS